MKKIHLIMLLFVTILLATSCADNKVIDGKEYRPYGLFNQESCKNDSIHYEVAIDGAISGAVFFQCAFVPTIYVYGFNLWEPICKKSDWDSNPNNKGKVN